MKKFLGLCFCILAVLLFALATATLFKVSVGTALGVMAANFAAYFLMCLGVGCLKS